MDRLKYISTERMFEGVLVEITDGGVTIDLKGRLGQFKIPKRMIISAHELQIGQEVGFMMSYPEVLDAEPNKDYVYALEENKRRQQEMQEKNKAQHLEGEI